MALTCAKCSKPVHHGQYCKDHHILLGIDYITKDSPMTCRHCKLGNNCTVGHCKQDEYNKIMHTGQTPDTSQLFSIQRKRLEMIESLSDSVREAGGDPMAFMNENMTLKELVDALAQNGIRFFYDKSSNEGKDHND